MKILHRQTDRYRWIHSFCLTALTEATRIINIISCIWTFTLDALCALLEIERQQVSSILLHVSQYCHKTQHWYQFFSKFLIHLILIAVFVFFWMRQSATDIKSISLIFMFPSFQARSWNFLGQLAQLHLWSSRPSFLCLWLSGFGFLVSMQVIPLYLKVFFPYFLRQSLIVSTEFQVIASLHSTSALDSVS